MKLQKLLFGSVIATLFAASAAFAVPITGTGTGSDGPVSASANLTFVDSTHLLLTLTNTLSASLMNSAGQALSDFEFNLSGGTITGIASSSGTLVNVNADKSVTNTTTPPTTTIPPGQWSLNTNVNVGGSTFGFQLIALGNGQPDFMIVPDADSFPNAHAASLLGGQFNPWVRGTATFFLNGTGFSGDTTITSSSFSFGTGPETFIPGVPGVPDSGATVALLGLAMVGLAAFRAKFRKA